uniref:PH domain-containing protein n=1 Tax=Ciona savignyi TaxID=51511 RepID=H2ZL94_CIOSA
MTGRPSLTNDEQLWLMKQVKMSCMTVDEAVSWTEARTNEIQLEEETNNISKDKKSFKPGKTLKKFLPRRSRNKSSDGNNASIVRKPVERSSVSSEEHVETSGNQDLRSKQVYNFSIYKCSKHKVPQKRIMQIDFGAKVISLIHHGNLLTNYPFSSLVNVDGQEGKKVFIYFDDSQELELNAENLADKTKLIRLLNVISEQNEYEERGQPFDPCEKLQLSFKIIKEGYLEKKGAYSAINWNKRLVVIRSGELAYYRVEEE